MNKSTIGTVRIRYSDNKVLLIRSHKSSFTTYYHVSNSSINRLMRLLYKERTPMFNDGILWA